MRTVLVSFPAETANISLARVNAAALAARADLPLDRLEDVRLAVDEAVTQAIAMSSAHSDVECRFLAQPGALDIQVSVATEQGQPPPTDTFGWTILAALVDSAVATIADGTLTITLRATTRAVRA